jgi:hypothetical protein
VLKRASWLVLLAGCNLLLAMPCAGQEVRRYELSAGYAYMRVDSSAGALSLQGISFSLARNFNRRLAIVGDGGGYHLEGFRLGTVQAGLRVTARAGRASLYTQVMVGFAHANAGGRGFSSYHESVAWMAGGGLDWRVSDRVSLRLAEMDYLQTRLGGGVQHNFRVGAGVVIHFGDLR